MKFKMMSVIVGTEACIAKCPFCVSGEKPCKENLIEPEINWRNFDIACNLANRSNVDTVVLTSRGEPLLFPEQITEYLRRMEKYNFPFIELQTNGILLLKEDVLNYLPLWYDFGLTTVCISIVSEKYEKNKNNYTPNGPYMDLGKTIEKIHKLGFSVRLACVMCKNITSSVSDIKDLITFCKENKVEQLTLRPVNDEFRRESAKLWIEKNKLFDKDKICIKEWLDNSGTLLLELERLGYVYDINGQNVMFSHPLNMNTRDINPDNGRQLIFFQDGHLRYEWEKEGGVLL